MQSLRDKVAIVTGASRGIGKGCALELGQAGATVYVTGRSTSQGSDSSEGTVDRTAREITDAGGCGMAVACDHTDDSQVGELFERVGREQTRLDILVNSAFHDPGIAHSRPFWETPLSWYDDLLGAGTRGAYVATHFAAARMVDQGSGLIVNISSLGAAHYFENVAYGMGKAALDKLTRDAGRELRDRGVTLISIWPYMVRTEGVLDLVSKGVDLPLDGAESQRFVGRSVVALAMDPDVHQRTGKPFTSLELAQDYGFTDVDGSLPSGSVPPKRR
ncbi:SDR family NAD(P)-dependent oxidoreductase [Myxococcota bacterium]|nr:SDR family NAD(P)-dependent oxidoreductase [Myxococcota bacterium]